MRADARRAMLYMYAIYVAALRAKDQESLEASIAFQHADPDHGLRYDGSV